METGGAEPKRYTSEKNKKKTQPDKTGAGAGTRPSPSTPAKQSTNKPGGGANAPSGANQTTNKNQSKPEPTLEFFNSIQKPQRDWDRITQLITPKFFEQFLGKEIESWERNPYRMDTLPPSPWPAQTNAWVDPDADLRKAEAVEKAAQDEYNQFQNKNPLGTGWWTSRGVPKDQAEYIVQQEYIEAQIKAYMDQGWSQRYAEEQAKLDYETAKEEYDQGVGQCWQNTIVTGKEADRQRHISDVQNRTYIDPAPGVSMEELDAARKAATDTGENLFYTQMYNQKVLYYYGEMFSNTQMDGTDHSVLDEIKLLAIMENGQEKKKRKEAVLQKMEELGMKDGLNELFYPHFAGDGSFNWKDFGHWLRSSGEAGAAGFFKSVADTVDVTLGNILKGFGWEDNPASKWAEYENDSYASWKYNSNLNAEKLGGKGWNFGGEVVESAVGALPQLLLAYLTQGTSLAASEGSLATQAAYETGGILTKAELTTEAMMKNLQFWVSFSRTLGSDYKAAKEMGVNDELAAMGSVLTSLLNAAIEIGPDGKSGIQGIPYQTSSVWTLEGVLQWLEPVFQEGGEEGLQKLVTEMVAKFLYGSQEPILVPEEYMWDMGIGAASGALLGGGKIVTEMAVDTISGKNLGNGWRNAGDYASQKGLSVMESLNKAGLYGSESLAQSSPGTYSLYIQEAMGKGVGPDQALKYATAATAMKIGTQNTPIEVLLDSMEGDPKKAAQVMDGILKESGIQMTPTELEWFGNVAAKVSALQQDPAFATEIALEMLDGKSPEEAQTVASQKLWEDVLNREITSKDSQFIFSPDAGQGQAAAVIDTEAVSKYDNRNGQEVWGNGSGEMGDRKASEQMQKNSGEQSTRAFPDSGRADQVSFQGNPERDAGGTPSRWTVPVRDSEGREISREQMAHLQGTAITDANGVPVALYHSTGDMEFKVFQQGDVGFHFGTKEQAENRSKAKQYTRGRTFRVYLNIQNPIQITEDIMYWEAPETASYLYREGILSDSEYFELAKLREMEDSYDSPMSVRLREMLRSKGYDGIAYPNAVEGAGQSYIAFEDAQIIRSEITKYGLEGEKDRQSEAVPEAVEDDKIRWGDLTIGKSLSAKAKNYRVYDPESDEYFSFVEGSRIRNAKIFAGKGGVKPLRPEVIEGLTREFPTDKPSNWQHCKGIATLNFFGEERVAEVHWFQEETAGKHKFKIKKWIE